VYTLLKKIGRVKRLFSHQALLRLPLSACLLQAGIMWQKTPVVSIIISIGTTENILTPLEEKGVSMLSAESLLWAVQSQ